MAALYLCCFWKDSVRTQVLLVFCGVWITFCYGSSVLDISDLNLCNDNETAATWLFNQHLSLLCLVMLPPLSLPFYFCPHFLRFNFLFCNALLLISWYYQVHQSKDVVEGCLQHTPSPKQILFELVCFQCLNSFLPPLLHFTVNIRGSVFTTVLGVFSTFLFQIIRGFFVC